MTSLVRVADYLDSGPSADGLAQSFQQPFELGLAMLHPSHAVPQLPDVVS